MDQRWCASAILFRVWQGRAEGVMLDGCTLVLSYDFPGPTLYDGNATARLYMDEATTADQRRELEAIFQGTKRGPMAVFGTLIAQWLPTQTTPIALHEEGNTLTATVGRVGQGKSQRLKNDAGQAVTMQHAGFLSVMQFDNEIAQLAPSSSQWADPDMPHQFETKSGAVGTVTWRVS